MSLDLAVLTGQKIACVYLPRIEIKVGTTPSFTWVLGILVLLFQALYWPRDFLSQREWVLYRWEDCSRGKILEITALTREPRVRMLHLENNRMQAVNMVPLCFSTMGICVFVTSSSCAHTSLCSKMAGHQGYGGPSWMWCWLSHEEPLCPNDW